MGMELLTCKDQFPGKLRRNVECFSFIIKPDFKWEAGIYPSGGEIAGVSWKEEGRASCRTDV